MLLNILFALGILWIGFASGMATGQFLLARKIARTTCSPVLDRYDHDSCVESMRLSIQYGKEKR